MTEWCRVTCFESFDQSKGFTEVVRIAHCPNCGELNYEMHIDKKEYKKHCAHFRKISTGLNNRGPDTNDHFDFGPAK